ncbi:uncharacterized protein A4U43_C06F14760 [Asparagus officinalis]|uniref:Uncharacterized protein n=1 Tax=Asparagus officinalis TaxID=4686 RepID=A0A5P1EM79_ASPOF|nr:uncharacterized protein A4U43_C06F14760 [Asparagus officinalis]
MAPKTVVNKGKGKKVAGPSDDPVASSAFSVVHPSVLIPQHGAFGADGTQMMEYDFHYSSLEGILMFGDQEQEELRLLSEPSISTFRRLITDAPLESINRDYIVKPIFLFGDFSEDLVLLELGTYRWLRTVNRCSSLIKFISRAMHKTCLNESQHLEIFKDVMMNSIILTWGSTNFIISKTAR